jgi:hypothetical protein
LQEVKKQADEIVAVDAGASRTTKQIAQLFGAKVYGLRDFPEQCDPWELAVQMAKGDRVARLDLY